MIDKRKFNVKEEKEECESNNLIRMERKIIAERGEKSV